MRSKDWKAVKDAKVLLVGEDSNLQWSDGVAEVVMFADYYFRGFPSDDGERSRNVEAQNMFAQLMYVTGGRFKPEDVYVTNFCNDRVEAAPKGKRVLIPEAKAIRGLDHIEWILIANPTIEWVVPMSLQTNYWLQKLGFYGDDAEFVAEAEPKRVGLSSEPPYYQPVDGKAFARICGKVFDAKEKPVKVVPILAAKSYPLKERNLEQFGAKYDELRTYFQSNK